LTFDIWVGLAYSIGLAYPSLT